MQWIRVQLLAPGIIGIITVNPDKTTKPYIVSTPINPAYCVAGRS
ncbi:hypothetical protein [Mucilaginibacter sp.]